VSSRNRRKTDKEGTPGKGKKKPYNRAPAKEWTRIAKVERGAKGIRGGERRKRRGGTNNKGGGVGALANEQGKKKSNRQIGCEGDRVRFNRMAEKGIEGGKLATARTYRCSPRNLPFCEPPMGTKKENWSKTGRSGGKLRHRKTINHKVSIQKGQVKDRRKSNLTGGCEKRKKNAGRTAGRQGGKKKKKKNSDYIASGLSRKDSKAD